MKLNIGCGNKKLEGHVNIDKQEEVNPDKVVDLLGPWPFADDTFDAGVASHILEHIGPEPEKLFHVMKELYRVMKNGAVVRVVVPHPRHDIFLHDPTHVKAITPVTLGMFSKRVLEENRKKGILLTPFADYIGVDFDMDKALYLIDDQNIKPEMIKEIEKNFAFYEKHYSNIVSETHVNLTVRK